MNESDEFTLVTKKHKRCAKRKIIIAKQGEFQIPTSSRTIADLHIISKIEELSASNFYRDLKNVLDCRLTGKKINVVCYGLGNFSQCYRSQYQLAFLKILIETVKNVGTLISSQIYDPLFNESEKFWLGKNGFFVSDRNEVGLKSISMDTLFYMPHCGRPLYNNVLFANWNCDQLKNILIVGNSFNKFKENVVSKEEFVTYRYLFEASNFCREVCLRPFNIAPEAFNDLSLHYFDSPSTLSARDNTQPVYDSDCEIIM